MRLPGKPESVKQYTVFSDFLEWSLQQPAILLCTNAKLCTCLCTSNSLPLLHHSIWWISIQTSILLLPAVPVVTEVALATNPQEGWCRKPKSFSLRILPSCFRLCRYQAGRQMSLLQSTRFDYSQMKKFSQASRPCIQNLKRWLGCNFPICPPHSGSHLRTAMPLLSRWSTDE